MKNYPVRYIIIVLLAVLVLPLAVVQGETASAQGMDTITIVNPADGETVSGLLDVTGSINFADFLKYELFLKSGDSMTWGATVYAPVMDAKLATLDTRTFMDGTYQLVIRKVQSDSNYEDVMGPTFTIKNDLGAPLPHPEVESSPLYAPTTNNALVRVKNCSGKDLEFDFNSPDGFCSAADLWIMSKPQDSPICTYEDVFLIPCEYRGTAWGSGEDRARTYSFIAESGKVYEITYPGRDLLYINTVEPEEPGSVTTSSDTAAPAASDSPSMTDVGGGSGQAPAAAPESSSQELPTSGQAAPESSAPFIVVALGLILFMIVGGVMAMRRGKASV